jgi:4-amino-4-deoxy-L-arabinose transferase-like glycosyltransferase
VKCRRPATHNVLLAVLLLLALYAQMMGSVRLKSATYDEQEYVARGYAVLRTGDMRLRLRHPLLTNLISAAPLLLLPDLELPTDHRSWTEAAFHEFSAEFLWNYNRGRADQIVYLSRWPMMLLTVVLAAFVYRWAQALYGPGGALLALALVAFDPNLIAHGRLANTDIGATAFIFIAAYAFWKYQRQPSGRRLLLAGIACGLAQTTRFTALLLFPVFGLEALAAAWQDGNSLQWRKLVQTVLVFLLLAGISLGTIWAVYGFTWGPIDGIGLSLPSPDHWGEFLSLIHRLNRADRAFLLGRVYEGGWWPYFLVAFAVKTPLPTLILIGWAIVRVIRRRRLLRDAPILLPAAAYFAIAVAGNLNTGYRLILPILPFLALHAARLAPSPTFPFSLSLPLSVRCLLPLALAIWLALSVFLICPHYLAYFNESVGPRNGYKVLVDSNLDWGQDLPGLRNWMDEQNVKQVYLSWFGTASPEHYGVRYRSLPGWPPFENPALRVYHPRRPLPGMYAISATNLQGVLLDRPDTFAFFWTERPIAQIGHSILVYEVPATAPPANLALGSVRLDQISAGLLDAHLVTNDLRLRWFDPTASLVLMPQQQQVCYAIAGDPPLAKPLATRFLDNLEPLAQGAGFRLYPCPDEADVDARLDIAAAAPVLQSAESKFAPGDDPDARLPVPLPASFDGQLAFLGYEILTSPAPGGETSLLTYWRVLERPEHSLKIFVHLLDDHSNIWGQQDSLGAPVEGWHAEDVIVHLHAFAIAADAPPGRYWIEVGLYDPQTTERLPVVGDDRLLLQQIRLE